MSEPVYLTKEDVQDMIVKALDRYHQELIVQLEAVIANESLTLLHG